MLILQKVSLNKYFQRINYYSCILLAFWLPLYKKLLPYAIAIFIITWLLEGDIIDKFKKNDSKYNRIVLTTAMLFFLVHFIGLFYSKNINAGLFDIQVKLSMLILPITFLTINDIIIKKRKVILFSFVIGNIIASLYCLGVAFYNSIDIIPSGISFNPNAGSYDNFFFYFYLSKFHHPSYASLYLAFSIIIAINFILDKKTGRWIRILLILCIGLNLTMIYLLSSKAGIISGIITLIGVSYIVVRKINKILILGSLGIIILISGYFFINNPRVQILVNSLDKSDPRPIAISSSIRLEVWQIAISLIQDNLICGVGTGDVHKELNKAYKVKGFHSALEQNLNVHNQFLETFVTVGIVGFVTLLSLFIIPIRKAFSGRDNIFLFLLLLTGTNFLFESVLNTIAGVTFFSFFYYLLVYQRNNT